MNDDISKLLKGVDWPEASPTLGARIMASIKGRDDSPAPWVLLNTPVARFGIGLCLAACLIAGIIAGSTFNFMAAPSYTQWPTTSISLAYMLPS